MQNDIISYIKRNWTNIVDVGRVEILPRSGAIKANGFAKICIGITNGSAAGIQSYEKLMWPLGTRFALVS